MTTKVLVGCCAACGADGPGYIWDCQCRLCLVCLQGLVKTCPACGQPSRMWDRRTWDRTEGDASAWWLVGGLVLLAAFLLAVAR